MQTINVSQGTIERLKKSVDRVNKEVRGLPTRAYLDLPVNLTASLAEVVGIITFLAEEVKRKELSK